MEFIAEDNIPRDWGPWSESERTYAYLYSCSEELSVIKTLKNMILVEEHCDANGIPLVYSFVEHRKFRDLAISDNIIFRSLFPVLRGTGYCEMGILDEDIVIDYGRDRSHPGPRSHERFGEQMYEKHRSLMET